MLQTFDGIEGFEGKTGRSLDFTTKQETAEALSPLAIAGSGVPTTFSNSKPGKGTILERLKTWLGADQVCDLASSCSSSSVHSQISEVSSAVPRTVARLDYPLKGKYRLNNRRKQAKTGVLWSSAGFEGTERASWRRKLKIRKVEDGFRQWVQVWRHELSAIKQERIFHVQQVVQLAEQERSLRAREALQYSELHAAGKIYGVTFTKSNLDLKLGPSIKRSAMVTEMIQKSGRSGGFVPRVQWGDELIAIDSQWVATWPCSLVMARLRRTTQRPIRLTFSTREGSMTMAAAQEVGNLVQSLADLQRQMADMERKYENQVEAQAQVAQELSELQQENERELQTHQQAMLERMLERASISNGADPAAQPASVAEAKAECVRGHGCRPAAASAPTLVWEHEHAQGSNVSAVSIEPQIQGPCVAKGWREGARVLQSQSQMQKQSEDAQEEGGGEGCRQLQVAPPGTPSDMPDTARSADIVPPWSESAVRRSSRYLTAAADGSTRLLVRGQSARFGASRKAVGTASPLSPAHRMTTRTV
jgi:hypothetical protein